MKTKIILVAILFLMTGMAGFGQSGLVGIVRTQANQSSIVRSWNNNLILYSEDAAGQGYFSLVEHLTSGTPVLMASVPQNVHVHDFRVIDDSVYFGGDTIRISRSDTMALVGRFGIVDLFHLGGSMSYSKLYSDVSHPSYLHLSIRRIEVYRFQGKVHMVAVGNIAVRNDDQQATPFLETGLFDIVMDNHSFKFTLGPQTNSSEGVFFDLAQTQKYIVSVAHKGIRTDMDVAGYMFLRPFYKDADPLNSIYGTHLTTTDGATRAADNILAVGTSLDTFMLALTSETNSSYQKELDKMYVNSSGYVTYSCHTDVVQPIPGTHDHNLFDVAFDGPSGTLAVANNCNMSQTAVADVYTPISICGPSGKELSHNSIFPNSISEMPSSRLAISGMASQGLGLSVHPILGGGSCMRTTTIPTSTGRKRGMTNREPCHIIPGSVEKASWIPDITITTFQTICEKD